MVLGDSSLLVLHHANWATIQEKGCTYCQNRHCLGYIASRVNLLQCLVLFLWFSSTDGSLSSAVMSGQGFHLFSCKGFDKCIHFKMNIFAPTNPIEKNEKHQLKGVIDLMLALQLSDSLMVEESRLQLGNGKGLLIIGNFIKCLLLKQTITSHIFMVQRVITKVTHCLCDIIWYLFIAMYFSQYFTCVNIFYPGMQKVSESMNCEGLCFSEVDKTQRSLLRARNQRLHHGSMFVSKNPTL